jgi:hypothetical protein
MELHIVKIEANAQPVQHEVVYSDKQVIKSAIARLDCEPRIFDQ